MIRTPLCDLFGIEAPVIQASFGPWSAPGLAAAVSNAGGLGTFGAVLWQPEPLRQALERLRALTDRPFAVNHSLRPFNEELFALALEFRPRVISLAHGDPGDLPRRAHDAGALFMHMVTTVRQAYQAAERGADVIIAQGGEAAGFGGAVSTMVLVPQVVDAVRPLPVVASGGIADGRGLAAALALGAQGINIGTRFLASAEASVGDDWKLAILAAESEDAVKAEFADEILPTAGESGYRTLPRVLRTPFVEEWNRRRHEIGAEAPRLRAEVLGALHEGRLHELLPFTGQTAGMIREVLPAAEIMRRILAEAEVALGAVAGAVHKEASGKRR
ncbi:MAG TPA: nitronate monooxygenase [Roseiflexaceae bacterium]|nr:nitronate monooxygenase [Roseiflexaceae bacterium]